uniref:Uncharacterized protein n=1 Tax=Anguilla anguilla TaxID=7936 RepID=A0A0E9WGV8_ANGAN
MYELQPFLCIGPHFRGAKITEQLTAVFGQLHH